MGENLLNGSSKTNVAEVYGKPYASKGGPLLEGGAVVIMLVSEDIWRSKNQNIDMKYVRSGGLRVGIPWQGLVQRRHGRVLLFERARTKEE